MTSILTGIFASQISGHLTPPWSPAGAYDALATVVVPSGGASSVTFSGIPTGYKNLQIRGIMLTTSAGGVVDATFNNDSGANYSRHRLVGNGSGVDSFAQTSISSFRVFGEYAGTGASPLTAGIVMDVFDYSSTKKNKTARIFSGVERNGSGEVQINSAGWYNSGTAINTITFSCGSPFSQYTQFALYGVK